MKNFTKFLLIAVIALVFLSSNAEAVTYTFTTDLTVGSVGSDVVALQTFLEERGFLTMPVGVPKGYFGPSTQAALASYQASVGISPASGFFGPLTRAHVNNLTSQVEDEIRPVTILYPKGGEEIKLNQTHTFTWDTIRQGMAEINLVDDTGTTCLLGETEVTNRFFTVALTENRQCVSSITLLTAGNYRLHIRIPTLREFGRGEFFRLSPANSITILPNGTIQVPYGQSVTLGTINSSRYTARISQGSLPPGLSLTVSGRCGVIPCTPNIYIGGTPTMVGEYPFTLSITENMVGGRTIQQTYTLKVLSSTLVIETEFDGQSSNTIGSEPNKISGEYQIRYEIQALHGDVYIPMSASRGVADSTGAGYYVKNPSQIYTGGTAMATLESNAEEVSGHYVIRERAIEDFILDVVFDETVGMSGTYKVALGSIGYKSGSINSNLQKYVFDDDQQYDTDFEYISNPTPAAVNLIPAISSLSRTSGPVGTSVTITGTGFNSNSQVYFGGNSRGTTYISPTSLKITVPSTASQGIKVITIKNGSLVSNSINFTVTTTPTTSSSSYQSTPSYSSPSSYPSAGSAQSSPSSYGTGSGTSFNYQEEINSLRSQLGALVDAYIELLKRTR